MDYPFRQPGINANTHQPGINIDASPTIAACQAARDQLQTHLVQVIRDYEDRYGVTVRRVNLNHSLAMGHPSRTCRALVDIEL